MTEELKTQRLNLVLTPDEMNMLQELANENAGQNKSFMMRLLLERAWKEPKKFGLHVPKAASLGQLMPVRQ